MFAHRICGNSFTLSLSAFGAVFSVQSNMREKYKENRSRPRIERARLFTNTAQGYRMCVDTRYSAIFDCGSRFNLNAQSISKIPSKRLFGPFPPTFMEDLLFLNSCTPIYGYLFIYFFFCCRFAPKSYISAKSTHLMYVLLLLLVIRLITFSSRRSIPSPPVSRPPSQPFPSPLPR